MPNLTSAAQIEAVKRYERANLKRVMLNLRLNEDSDIIADWDLSKANGVPGREWIRAYFEAKPEVPNDLVSKSKVEQLLWDFRIDPDVIRNIMGEI